MTKRGQAFGHNRERQVKKRLEAKGWFVIRAPASLGLADLVALKDKLRPMMIEVKGTAAGPFTAFGPADRAALLGAAAKAGADPVLAWWPAHGELLWIPSAGWPGA